MIITFYSKYYHFDDHSFIESVYVIHSLKLFTVTCLGRSEAVCAFSSPLMKCATAVK